MPADEDIPEAVAADSAQAEAQGMERAAQAIPMAAEPLKGSLVNTLGQLVAVGIERITSGEVKRPTFAKVSGQVEQVPADIGSKVVTFAAMADKLSARIPEFEAYLFDPMQELTTNDGLKRVGT